jgi:DNA replication and repair protein RecF
MTSGESPSKLCIRSLRLENYRTYKSKKFNFDGEIIIFIGKNGVGKSSVLEAISLLGNLKSFRSATDKDLIKYGSNQYFIEMDYESKGAEFKLGLGFGKKSSTDKKYERRMRINSELIEKISRFIGKIQTVVFAPDDINIIESGPQERRRFVDMLLCTIHNDYLIALQNYRRLLKLRSAFFIKSGRNVDEQYLGSFDNEIVKAAVTIQGYRKKFASEFQEIFDNYISMISSHKDHWTIKYIPSISEGEDPVILKGTLLASRHDDIKYKQTTRGVHRDRILFVKDEGNLVDISKTGSQGQKRTAVLALKMGQFEYTRKRTTEKPVLLIDDVLNELDIERRKKFIEFLQNAGQAFITATDISALDEFIERKKNTSKIQIFKLDEDFDQDSLTVPLVGE